MDHLCDAKFGQNVQDYFQIHIFNQILKGEVTATVRKVQTHSTHWRTYQQIFGLPLGKRQIPHVDANMQTSTLFWLCERTVAHAYSTTTYLPHL